MSGAGSTRSVVDAVIEVPVVTSFTRLGYDVRSRLAHWRQLNSYDLGGRVVLVTGATSGLGLVTAEQLAACGATVVLLGRDADKTSRVCAEIATRTGNARLSTVVADMGDLEGVRRVAGEIADNRALRADETAPQVRRLLAVADKFEPLGLDPMPMAAALSAALDAPRASAIKLESRTLLDAWLAARQRTKQTIKGK